MPQGGRGAGSTGRDGHQPAGSFALLLELRRPPEVYQQLPGELLERVAALRAQQAAAAALAPGGARSGGRGGGGAGPSSGGVEMASAGSAGRPVSEWPLGAGRTDRLVWKRAGELSGDLGAVGGCTAYMLEFGQDSVEQVQRLAHAMHACLLLEVPSEGKATCLPRPVPIDLQRWHACEQRLRSGALDGKVAYALMCLITSNLLPRDLVSERLLGMLAALDPRCAEVALYDCHAAGVPLRDAEAAIGRALAETCRRQEALRRATCELAATVRHGPLCTAQGVQGQAGTGGRDRQAAAAEGAAVPGPCKEHAGACGSQERADGLMEGPRKRGAVEGPAEGACAEGAPTERSLGAGPATERPQAEGGPTERPPAEGGPTERPPAEGAATERPLAGKVPVEDLESLLAAAVGASSDYNGADCYRTKRLLVTPTRVVCLPPEQDLSNRVVRHFACHIDHFYRVCFGDEQGEQVFLASTQPEVLKRPRQQPLRLGETESHAPWDDPSTRDYRKRMRDCLSKGIPLLGEHLELLAYSSNQVGAHLGLLAYSSDQLRTASAWFMSPASENGKPLGAEGVRYWIGDLSHIQNRAKYAARLGQAFSCTYRVLKDFEYRPPTAEAARQLQWQPAPSAGDLVEAALEPPLLAVSGGRPGSGSSSGGSGSAASAVQEAQSGGLGEELPPSASEWQSVQGFPDEPDGPTPFDLLIPDIEIIDEDDHEGRAKYCVSDGVGRISTDLAARIMGDLGLDPSLPAPLQVRFEGCKGMLVPWGTDVMPPGLIQVRPSMRKFDSTHSAVEVVQVASWVPGFINRQIIILLLALKVSGEVVMDRAREMLTGLDDMLRDKDRAAQLLPRLGYLHPSTCDVVLGALSAGMSVSEPFIQSLLQNALLQLRDKTRVHLQHSGFLFGVLDELGVLGENQVFVQVQRPGMAEPMQLHGVWVLVTKNPCLHPGDIRVLRAARAPALAHLVNCVVFPRNVSRPHSNAICGSDLDGDMYFVCWDSQLIPKDPDDWPCLEEPADYTSAQARMEKEIRMDPHLVDFFMEFQMSDTLGQIANAHVALADQHPLGAASEECKRLARLHAVAVDYPKTCIPAKLEEWHKPKAYPHFMRNSTRKLVRSTSVLGRIHDLAVTAEQPAGEEVDAPPNAASQAAGNSRRSPTQSSSHGRPSSQHPQAAAPAQQPSGLGGVRPDPRLLLEGAPGWEAELRVARLLCQSYSQEMRRVMSGKYGTASEAEGAVDSLFVGSTSSPKTPPSPPPPLLKVMSKVMSKYGAASEAELWTGFLPERAGPHKRKRMDLRQQVLLEVGVLKRKFVALFEHLPLPESPCDVAGSVASASGRAGTDGSSGGATGASNGALSPDDFLMQAAREALVQGSWAGGEDAAAGARAGTAAAEAGVSQAVAGVPGGEAAGATGAGVGVPALKGAGGTDGVRSSSVSSHGKGAQGRQPEGAAPVPGLVVRASAWYCASYEAAGRGGGSVAARGLTAAATGSGGRGLGAGHSGRGGRGAAAGQARGDGGRGGRGGVGAAASSGPAVGGLCGEGEGRTRLLGFGWLAGRWLLQAMAARAGASSG